MNAYRCGINALPVRFQEIRPERPRKGDHHSSLAASQHWLMHLPAPKES